MSFKPGQIGPIRNAGGPTGDGRASVAGPCGGVGTFGSNGKGSATDGETVTLNINYAAGHASSNNAFRMAFACGAPNEDTMGGATAVLTAADNGCTGTAGGQVATYNDNGVDGGIPAPNAIVNGGYDITCTLPLQNNAETQECTVALIDQRDWGGCVDITLFAAGVPEPPSPPPAPIIPNAATYRMLTANAIDTSAADFTCCPLAEGELVIAAAAPGAPLITGELKNVKASGCRTSALTTAPATDELFIASQAITLTKVDGTQNKYEGQTTLKGQVFDVAVSNQILSFRQNALSGEQPIVCDQEACGNCKGTPAEDPAATPACVDAGGTAATGVPFTSAECAQFPVLPYCADAGVAAGCQLHCGLCVDSADNEDSEDTPDDEALDSADDEDSADNEDNEDSAAGRTAGSSTQQLAAAATLAALLVGRRP